MENRENSVDIYWDNIPNKCEELLSDLVKRGLIYVNAPSSAEISISFVDQNEMKYLNKEHRGIDKVTDVLSFPFTDPLEWIDSGLPLALGDIIICTDVAQEQAVEYGHSFERELGFLVVHGLLHLAGYDHMDPEEEEHMRKAQRDILGELK